MNKIPILYIIDSFVNLAGSERNLFEVVTRIDKEKFILFVFIIEEGGMSGFLNDNGIFAKNLNIKRIYGFKAFREAFKLIKFIKKNRIQIVVTYHESSDFWGGLISWICRVPVVISSRRDMGFKLKKRHIAVYRMLNGIFDRIVTVSDMVKECVYEREGALWSRLLTIYNGVDLDKFNAVFEKDDIKKSLFIKEDWPVVGILATIRPVKGHKYFLEAASYIIKEFPKVYFLVVGWHYEQDYFRELQELSKTLKIEGNVIFTGGRSDTPAMLSVMDISVLSSLNEGFPNVVLESMASGKPVVATNVGGTAEAMVDGETGILVPACDARALADATLRLLRNKQLREEMGKAAKKYAGKRFNLNRMINDNEVLYENLLSEKTNDRKYSAAANKDFKFLKRFCLKFIKLGLNNILYYSGITFLMKRRLLKGNRLLIVTYHRICNNGFDPLGMIIKPENFERHLKCIRKYYNPVSLERAVEMLRSNERIPANSIVITFDDGYKDNYTNAAPLLKKYSVPATIFLSVQAINEQKMLWFDIIISAFKKTSKQRVDFSNIELKTLLLDTAHRKAAGTRKVVTFAKTLNNEARGKFIEDLLSKLEVNLKEILRENNVLNWEDIMKMKGEGVSFGNHSMSHSILTQLTSERLAYEISESKRIIKEKTGIDVKLFAYPNGGDGDFNRDIESLLQEQGYAAAFTLISGVNNGSSDLLSLKRVCITPGMETGLFGRFSKPLFVTRLSSIQRH